MKNLKSTTIKQIRNHLLNGEIKVQDLIKNTFNNINKDGENYLNTFVTVESLDNLEKQINESQERYANGTNKKLDGLPIAIKDNFTTKGIKTTCGSNILSNYIPTFDATVCKKLKDEGAIIIGKTNMDEFGMGSSSTNSYYGSVINPWSKKGDQNELYVAGGSSGGSAAAIAAGYCMGALGSDTGGSIRLPASYCGVVGYKPSYGIISRYGLVAYASSLDTAGVLTNNCDDAAELLDVLVGKDTENDSTSISFGKDILKEYKNKLSTKTIKDLVFGIPTDYLVKELDPDILELWQQVVSEIELHGGKVVAVDLPHTRYALPAYYLLATSEASSNLSRFDGVRYGYRHELHSEDVGLGLKDMYTKTRTEGFGEEVKKRIILGSMSLSRTQYDNFYTKAQKIRRLVSDDFKSVFGNQKVDVLITPVAPSPAFKQNQKLDPIHVYINDIMTIPISLAGVPAVSVPLKLSKENLPISVQLVSDRLNDDTLLFAANLLMNFDSFKDFNLKHPTFLK
ncbi:hypothetical protein DICPUDRAFT_39055 [Dictyostelium purpureum]|uniref:Glutamyl-tRNA(Gln) amidotransferase subunit A, mitochondrial n=1 Tax=Dictyostelium purpureum TaxID=5786 RepID=F0ZVL5_DICPU|nr:uncharacterized protein DICPUDRAFT_39055 [Dictyostelium purpureum]EGC32002.1 hypothetical protein DICPUDRAFT_39055 [Dictyostelium purpureum]|eukprot:XP_003291458.1 hypothetical protein DICPUDRAFT_39055 [Dictyostelium purpureum]